jgi:predicted CXXCH cytochrome family protein
MRFFKNTVAVLLPVLFLSMLFFTACESEKTVEKLVTVHDTVTVTINDTVALVIVSVDDIFAEPDSITQGGSIKLAANASVEEGPTDLTFVWSATGGTFSEGTNDTVVWKAPDEVGAYDITVFASNGEYVGLGTLRIGVGMYAPLTSVYYVGGATCAGCHVSKAEDWAATGHGHAWETLMASDHWASYCFPCHSVGYEGEAGNSGYDEAPIEMFVNVQCENCHGPGSAHVASPGAVKPVVSYEAETCGTCHEGAHHPYYGEWADSPHNFDQHTNHAVASASCQGCHEGVGALIRLSGDLSTFYGSGSIADRPDTLDVPLMGVTCAVCHDSHSAENPGQLRTVANVPLVEANGDAPVITEGGTGKLCMHCHHARRAADSQIANGYGHFGPHGSPQADIMAGKSAYNAVAPADFPWAGPSHLNVQNSCKTCHINMIEYGVTGPVAVTGHTFMPTVEACANCHGEISSFDDIMALDDFDGDGTIEGIQSEVEGLFEELTAALVASGLDTTGGVAHALGDTTISTYIQREAGYNLIYLEDDKSKGIHNPDYVIQLLQQSYQHLTGTPVPRAAILRDRRAVASEW